MQVELEPKVQGGLIDEGGIIAGFYGICYSSIEFVGRLSSEGDEVSGKFSLHPQ